MPDKTRMGEMHVQFLSYLFGLRQTKGSGNQWTDPIDARSSDEAPFRFAVEAKSTLGQSIAVSRDLIKKTREQAHGDIPMIGLRFYGSEDLQEVDEDWVVITADALAEILEEQGEEQQEVPENETALLGKLTEARVEIGELRREREELRTRIIGLEENLVTEVRADPDAPGPEQVAEWMTQIARLTGERDQARQVAEQLAARAAAEEPGELIQLRDELARLRVDTEWKTTIIARQRDQLEGSGVRPTLAAAMASPPPRFPWTVIFQIPSAQGSSHVGIHYDERGQMQDVPVTSVRSEPYGDGRRLFVNDRIVRHGELYVNGVLFVRVDEAEQVL